MKFAAIYDGLKFEVSPMEMVRLVGDRVGITDIDIDPAPGKTTIKAGSLTVTGKTLADACDAFCRKALDYDRSVATLTSNGGVQ